jgi:hypothetical protein
VAVARVPVGGARVPVGGARVPVGVTRLAGKPVVVQGAGGLPRGVRVVTVPQAATARG